MAQTLSLSNFASPPPIVLVAVLAAMQVPRQRAAQPSRPEVGRPPSGDGSRRR